MNLEEMKVKDRSAFETSRLLRILDYGKSTLPDRVLQATDTVADREMQDQLLDSMDLERERGLQLNLNAVDQLYDAKTVRNIFST